MDIVFAFFFEIKTICALYKLDQLLGTPGY